MRVYLGPVNAAQVQTELGAIYVTPGGKSGVRVSAPHLTVDGMPLQASAFLTGPTQSGEFIFVHLWDSKTQRFLMADNALQARLVNGSPADIVVLGKLAQVIAPAVCKFAEQNWALFLEAERRNINNHLAEIEGRIERERAKLAEKERELASVSEELAHLR